MRPRKIWANLGVSNIERTRGFYTALGFKSNDGLKASKELASFLVGDDDFIVHFFAHDALEPSYREATNGLRGSNELMFTISASTRQEVDIWADEVKQAGGFMFNGPRAFGEGYYGFGFADPDGHKWNVFYM